jgi:hypothetical protein
MSAAATAYVRPTAEQIRQRREWLYGVVRRVDRPPAPYGSPDWLRYDDRDPRKWVAVVICAEARQEFYDDLPGNLAREVEAQAREHKRLEDAEYQTRAAAHRKRWRHLKVVPDRPDPSAPRPGDYMGRGSAS